MKRFMDRSRKETESKAQKVDPHEQQPRALARTKISSNMVLLDMCTSTTDRH